MVTCEVVRCEGKHIYRCGPGMDFFKSLIDHLSRQRRVYFKPSTLSTDICFVRVFFFLPFFFGMLDIVRRACAPTNPHAGTARDLLCTIGCTVACMPALLMGARTSRAASPSYAQTAPARVLPASHRSSSKVTTSVASMIRGYGMRAKQVWFIGHANGSLVYLI